MKAEITTLEIQVEQEIARLCSDSSHTMPVLPPDDFEEQEEREAA